MPNDDGEVLNCMISLPVLPSTFHILAAEECCVAPASVPVWTGSLEAKLPDFVASFAAGPIALRVARQGTFKGCFSSR